MPFRLLLTTLTLLFYSYCFVGQTYAQQREVDSRFRQATSLTIGLSAKSKLTVAESFSFEYDSDDKLELSTLHFTYNYRYRLNKKLRTEFGLRQSFSESSDKFKFRMRLIGGLEYKFSLFSIAYLRTAFNAEYHFYNQDNYRTRYITSFRLYPKSIGLLKEYNFIPYTQLRFYYNQGGDGLPQYWPSTGAYRGDYPGNGFHRMRFYLGIAKKFENTSINLYSLTQRDFNLPFSKTKINTPDEDGDIKRSFSDFNAFGINISIAIKGKSKKSDKPLKQDEIILDDLNN